MRISSSFEQIQQLFVQLKTENITKGWNLHAQLQATAAPAAPTVVAPTPVAAPAPVAAEAEPVPKKRAARKFAASETEAPPGWRAEEEEVWL
jgi:hypothetical protein